VVLLCFVSIYICVPSVCLVRACGACQANKRPICVICLKLANYAATSQDVYSVTGLSETRVYAAFVCQKKFDSS
jgi:hypothetical protein